MTQTNQNAHKFSLIRRRPPKMSKFLSSLRNYTGSQANLPRPSPRAFCLTAHRLLNSEPQSRYARGGYHPVSVGELYNNSYKVVRQLGWGQYSTVWLMNDTRLVPLHLYKYFRFWFIYLASFRDNKLVAMKVMVGDMTCPEVRGGWDELGNLMTLRVTNPQAPGFGHVCHCQLLDSFTHEGPNGNHTCLIIEAMNLSMFDVFRSSGRGVSLPLPLVKRVCSHILLALQYMHEECGIVHTGELNLSFQLPRYIEYSLQISKTTTSLLVAWH